jgi:putative copper resistance protein D
MTGLLICARAFHFGSGMVLAGIVAFRWLVLLPALAEEADETWQKLTPFFRRLNALWTGSWFVLVASGWVWFGAVGAGMSGASFTECLIGDTARTVFFQTQFGTVSQGRLGLAAILGVVMATLAWNRWPIRRARSALELAAGLLAFALLVSVAWTGHAAAGGGPDRFWRILADATHLFAASIWPTGLLPFALFLSFARGIDDAAALRAAQAVVRRFSALSFGSVGLLAASGIVNACFAVGSFPALVTTDYGRLLCLKLVLFLAILGFAAWNRYRIVPLLSSRVVGPDRDSILPLLRRLQSFVATEFILSVAIIFVVGLLGITPPPHHRTTSRVGETSFR